MLVKLLRKFFESKNDSERKAWVISKIRELPAGLKILDAGCSTQPYRCAASHLDYITQDFGEYDGKGDGTGMQSDSFAYGKLDYRCDIWKIPAPDASFDAVLCTEVLEHIPFPNETILEFARLLKPGGTLILTAPFASIPHMTPYFFYSGFSAEYYKFILVKAGMNISEIATNGDQYLYIEQELRRFLKIEKRLAIKMLMLASLAPAILISRISSNLKWGEMLPFPYLPFGFHIVAKRSG